MKALLIGGTGTISMAITRQLIREGWDLTLLNRGNRTAELPEGVKVITADISDEAETAARLAGQNFDVAADFIAFAPEQAQRDVRLFSGKVSQYLFISTASAYHKPARNWLINEGTPLANPYWAYSRNKIACEDALMRAYREEGFPVTIVRPSHTYDERKLPVGVHGKKGSWQVARRILDGKPVIIHGDGSSLWTLTFNTDFARGFVGLMGNPHAIGEAFQITSDEALTWDQIYGELACALGRELKAVHVPSEFLAEVGPQYDYRGALLGDKMGVAVFDNGKLKRAVPGFQATVRYDQGVRGPIRSFKSRIRSSTPGAIG